jgi:hypothetical protein
MVLGWGLKSVASPGQEGMIDRARFLLDELARKAATVIVPAPVLTEFLHNVAVNEKSAFLAMFEKRFIVAPFDALAAAQADKLWLKVKADPHLCPKYPGPCVVNGRIPKPVLKYDVQIVAIAMAQKVDAIYSDDPHIRTIAQGMVPVLDLPEVKEQGELFAAQPPKLRIVRTAEPMPVPLPVEDDED